LSEFGACYVNNNNDLLDKQQFLDYYNSEIVQLLTSQTTICNQEPSKKDFEKACKLLVGWGLEPPSVKIVSTKDFKKIRDNLTKIILELNRNGYCSSNKRGRMSVDDFKIIYKREMQDLKQSLRANRDIINFNLNITATANSSSQIAN
jgi:uncharacterized protein YeeX (DUF496 family)